MLIDSSDIQVFVLLTERQPLIDNGHQRLGHNEIKPRFNVRPDAYDKSIYYYVYLRTIAHNQQHCKVGPCLERALDSMQIN